MLLNITLLLIISLLIYIIISTLYIEVKYIVVATKQIKTFPLKRGYTASPVLEGEHWEGKNCNKKSI